MKNKKETWKISIQVKSLKFLCCFVIQTVRWLFFLYKENFYNYDCGFYVKILACLKFLSSHHHPKYYWTTMVSINIYSNILKIYETIKSKDHVLNKNVERKEFSNIHKNFFISFKISEYQQFKNKLFLYSTNPVKRLLKLLPHNIKNQT